MAIGQEGIVQRFLYITSKLAPARMVDWTETALLEADMNIDPRIYLGGSIWSSYVIALVAFALFSRVYGAAYLPFGIFGLLFIFVSFFTLPIVAFLGFLRIIADNRAAQIEEVLPEALLMVAANMRAGMSLDNAIFQSAKAEFGPLADEIRLMSAKTLKMPLQRALFEMGERVRSTNVKRAVKLLVLGSVLGGKMAALLYGVARDGRDLKGLNTEIKNATVMYAIFIAMGVMVISPFLFATSVFYSQIVSTLPPPPVGLQEQIAQGTTAAGVTAPSLPFFGGTSTGDALTTDEIRGFTLAAMTMTSFFSALLLGIIRHGKLSRGFGYVPVFVVGSLIAFWVSGQLLTALFTSLLGH